MFACDRVEPCIFGRSGVNIETDRQPLEIITPKPLTAHPNGYSECCSSYRSMTCVWKYKNGKHMYLADTLRRAHLSDISMCEEEQEVAQVEHTSTMAMSAEQLQRLRQASAEDPVLNSLRQTILKGWPPAKGNLPNHLMPYYDFRDELTVEGPLVFKGPVILIPAALWKAIITACHESHIRVEGCIRRARDHMFWPRMSSELKA